MDSRMTHPHGTVPYQQQDHSHNATGLDAGGEGKNGDNHHHDKHSVLKKVKEKAKKIKDTLKPHSHGTHAHEGEGHDLEEEGGDDEDEEILHHDQDPQLRAPLVPSAGQPKGFSAGRISVAPAKAGEPTRSGDERVSKGLAELTSVPSGPFGSGTGSGLLSPVLEDAAGRKLKEDPHAPKHKSDHDYSPSNYETKVTDPTASGGGDAGISPILQSMDKMNIYSDKEAAKREFPSAGSHDQFSPEPNKDSTATAQGGGLDAITKPASATMEYGKKIAATVAGKLSPAYDKVAEVGTSVVSRVQGGTTETDKSGVVKDNDKGVSVKEYFAEKLRPGEEDRALSQVISEVLHKQNVEAETEAETGAREVVNPIESFGTDVNYNSAAPATGGTSVVDKLKDAVGSWFGKPQPSSSHPMPSSTVAGAISELSGSGEIGAQDAAAAARESRAAT